MKPIIDRMKDVGATDTTINFFLVCTMLTFFVIILGLLVISGYLLIVKEQQPPAWVVASFSTIITLIGVLLSVSHATQNANYTQTRTVAEQQAALKPIVESQAQSSLINAQTIQQVLAAMATVNQTNANSSSSTATQVASTDIAPVIQANTEATKANTVATIEEMKSG